MVDALRMGDDDAVEMLIDIERTFGVVFSQADVSALSTLENLHALILREARFAGGQGCATAMAFFRLRRLLEGQGLEARARPGTLLAGQFLASPRGTRAILGHASGLVLPPLPMTRLGLGLGLVVFVAGLVAAFALSPWIIVVVPALWWSIVRFDPGSWRGDWETLCALADTGAHDNYAVLVRQGARHTPATYWRELLHRVRLMCGADGAIQPTTRLFT